MFFFLKKKGKSKEKRKKLSCGVCDSRTMKLSCLLLFWTMCSKQYTECQTTNFDLFFSKSAKYMVREILGIDSTGTIFYCSSSFPCPSKNKNKTCVQMRYVVYKWTWFFSFRSIIVVLFITSSGKFYYTSFINITGWYWQTNHVSFVLC